MSSTDLNLNTDIIHNRTETYSSLSDLYGVDLFTDQKIEERQQYEARVAAETERVRRSVFGAGRKAADEDEAIAERLFQEPLTIAKKQGYEESMWSSARIGVIGSVIICVIFLILWIRYWKKMRQPTEGRKHGNRKNQNISHRSY